MSNKTPKAFPVAMSKQTYDNQDCSPYNEGMDLRDYFAAKAMQAMISNPNIKRPHPENGDVRKQLQDFAIVSYEYADAMLKQREQYGN